MSGFLDRMAEASRARLADARTREPLAALRSRAVATPRPPPLQLKGSFNLIAEFKRRSPALGRLGDDDLAGRVTAYAQGGAAAVSVLTEPTQFHGNLEHLAAAAEVLTPIGIPVMRKDFLLDPYQLHEARAAGAGGVLLIVRMLSRDALREMLDCARELSLFVLLESFDTDDIGRAMAEVAVGVPERSIRISRSEGTPPPDPGHGALAPGPDPGHGAPAVLFGVNCRDLQTLEVRPQRFAELAEMLPEDVPCVAESGITTPDECAEVVRDGYQVALVGRAVMTAVDPASVVRTMLAAGRAAA
ncbi:MAG: indole-3-glycerol phosphate synthase TrpC [Steroidobacteraceae bacterium]